MSAIRVFVSHTHDDSKFCQSLVLALRSAGADVWYDEHNLGFGRIRETIERELLERTAFVLILSEHALKSRWVRDETDWFYELLWRDPSRRLVPVVARVVSPDAIWLFVRGFKRIEAAEGVPFPEAETINRTLMALDLGRPSQTTTFDRGGGEFSPARELTELSITFADGTVELYSGRTTAQGANGMVFRSADGKHTVKLFYLQHTETDAGIIKRLDDLIQVQNPVVGDTYWTDYFAWPEKRVVEPGPGYQMATARDSAVRLDHYFYGRMYRLMKPEQRLSLRGQVETAIKVAEIANRLEVFGLVHPDLTAGDIMLSPDGRVTLINCDIVYRPSDLPPPGVIGQPRFLAPEQVSRQADAPTLLSMRHVYAVLLYMLLLNHHPLEGQKVYDQKGPWRDEQLMLGSGALYVEHPSDTSNRPDFRHLSTADLSIELQNVFRQAFVEGLHAPIRRPRPANFVMALHAALDQLIPCSNESCEWHGFLAQDMNSLVCPLCGTQFKGASVLPVLYLFDGADEQAARRNVVERLQRRVVGWHRRFLRRWHVRLDVTPIHNQPMDIYNTVPQMAFELIHERAGILARQKERWTLTNLVLPHARYISASDKVGQWQPWPMNVSLTLVDNLLIQFGPAPHHLLGLVRLVRVP